MPITEAQLASGLAEIRNQFSDDHTIDIVTARKQIAVQEARLIADFVIGRETTVTGASASGGSVTGTGIIQV